MAKGSSMVLGPFIILSSSFLQEATAPLLERIGVLEKATPGRQTLLGEDKEVKKEKGFKGLPLRI